MRAVVLSNWCMLRAGDALVRVYATSITRTELTWDQTYQNPDGSPRIPTIPRHEISGVIESVPLGVRDGRRSVLQVRDDA
jgi:NADPH:quinone reductase-like Zn-dependent oxidoreductase